VVMSFGRVVAQPCRARCAVTRNPRRPREGNYMLAASTAADVSEVAVTMKPLAHTPETMPGSGIREIVNLAVTMPDVIRLEVGEPNFPTPQHIVDGAARAVADGFTKYTQSAGLLSLRTLIAERVSRTHGFPVTPDQVNVTVGGVQGVQDVAIALLEPGEEALVPDPGWPNYEMAVMVREAAPIRYPLSVEHGFVPRVEDLERRVTSRTKLLFLNSPGNPTGAVFPRAVVEDLVAFARRHDLYVLADEVYGELVFEGEHVSPAIFDRERVIVLNSFSKTYAMTGWRIGYVVANDAISRVVAKIQEPMISCVSGMVQKAAEAALTGPQDCVREMRESYRERRDAVVTVLKAHDSYLYTPHGAFYIMVDISRSGMGSREFALALLEDQRVAVAPGTAFGDAGSDFVRISLATEKAQLIEGVERLCRFVQVLQARPRVAIR
jgi:aspartate/methionine/tyrosine aminotransferase